MSEESPSFVRSLTRLIRLQQNTAKLEHKVDLFHAFVFAIE